MNENINKSNPESLSIRKKNERMWGAILIVIGLFLLGRNMNITLFNNWWALSILMPAFGCFSSARKMAQEAGRVNFNARSAAIVGVVLTLVAALFLFDLNWMYLGPGMLLLGGFSLVINALLPD